MNIILSCNIRSADALAIVRDNRAALASCQGPHTFEPITDGRMRFRCTKCNGVMDTETMRAYGQGQVHGVIRAAQQRTA